MSILFINGSPNKNGNTAALAAELLKDHEYETLNLTDYTIGAYGQNLPGDGLDAVIGAMKQADTIVIGSPLSSSSAKGSGAPLESKAARESISLLLPSPGAPCSSVTLPKGI